MTPQEIQIAVAEEMGWEFVPSFDSGYHGKAIPEFWYNAESGEKLFEHEYSKLPPYTTSIDAIREACLERFKDLNEWDFERQLLNRADAITTGDRIIWQLTALDWCEAFLNTCKILKNEKYQ